MDLLFASRSDAQIAINAINASMGLSLGDGDVTTTWDVPKEDAVGKWAVAKPEDRFMAAVSGYIEGSPTWPADPGMA